MSQNVEELVLSVRADTRHFQHDVARMRGELEGPLAAGVERAGRSIETALGRAIRNGKLGFDDLKRVALRALGEIAAAALKAVLVPNGQGGGSSQGFASILSSLLGLNGGGSPGRSHGGPVSAGRAYLVGERGPELFVPGSQGRVIANGSSGSRNVNVAISVNGERGKPARNLERSSRQVARAVRQAIGGRA